MNFNAPNSIAKLLKHDDASQTAHHKFQAENFVSTEQVHCIEYLEDENVLLVGLGSGAVLSMNNKCKYKESTIKHSSAITNLRHHEDDFVALSLDGEMSFWKMCHKTGAPEFRGWLNHKESQLSLFTSAINQYYIVACKSISFCHKHSLTLWKREDKNEIPNVLSVESSKSDILCVQLNDRLLYYGLKNGHLMRFDVQKPHAKSEVQVSSHPIWSIAVTDNFLYVAARNDGVYKVDKDFNVYQVIKSFEDLILQINIHNDKLYCLTNYGEVKRFSFECLDSAVNHKESLEWSKQFGLDERKYMAFHSICNYPNIQFSDKQLFVLNPDDNHVIKLIDLDASNEEMKNNKHYFMKMYFNHSKH